MPEYIKHLIECNCVLSQYELIEPTVFHKFVAFSIINDDGSIKPSMAQCNNCRGIHQITEVNTSTKLKKETAATLPDVEEIKTNLPEKLVMLLGKYNLELTTWQEIKFIFDYEKWGRPVILLKEEENGERHGKYLMIASRQLWTIDSFSTEDV